MDELKNKISELQELILKCFYDLQCDEDDGLFNDDETPVMRYSFLECELKKLDNEKYRLDMISRDFLKPHVISLRNMGLIYLGCSVDSDYIPSGSGYMLTDNGAELVKELFYKEVI